MRYLFVILLAALTLLAQDSLVGSSRRRLATGGGGGTTINAGFEFRSTSGYVATLSGDQWVGAYGVSTNYPQTTSIGGHSTTYGYYPYTFDNSAGPASCTGSAYAYDRNSAIDARLAGIAVLLGSDGCLSFGVLLPSAGAYDIVIAAGDANSAQGPFSIKIYDGTTLATTLVSNLTTSALGRWFDASGTERDAASWASLGSMAKATITFSTTHLALAITAPGGSAGTLSYFHVTNH